VFQYKTTRFSRVENNEEDQGSMTTSRGEEGNSSRGEGHKNRSWGDEHARRPSRFLQFQCTNLLYHLTDVEINFGIKALYTDRQSCGEK